MVIDFTPDNTPPVAIALGAGAPSDDAPAAVTVGAAPDNTPPVAKSSVAGPGIDNPPDAIARGGVEPDNASPVAVTVGAAPDNTPPVAVAVGAAPDNTAPAAIVPGVPVPDNTAPASLIPAVPQGSNEPPQPMPWPILPAATDDTVNTPTLHIGDMFELNAIYGHARMPVPGSILRAQVQLTEEPLGAAAKINLVDGDGVALGLELTVPIGEKFAETVVPGTGLAYLAGANVRAKVTQIGSDPNKPGGYAVITIYTQIAAA